MLSNGKLWIGLGLSVVLLGVFLLTVDLSRLWSELAHANYWFLGPAVAMYFVSLVFRTLRWKVMLGHIRTIPVGRLFPVVVVGYMANNLLPMRLGELVRSYYVGEREQISKTSALVTVLIERVMDALTLLFFIAAIAAFVPLSGVVEALGDSARIAWPLFVAGLGALFIAAFGTLLLFAYQPARTRALGLAIIRPLPARFSGRLERLLDMFMVGLLPLRSPHKLAGLFALSVPIWLFEAGLFFFVGFAFGLDVLYANLVDLAVAMVLVTAVANIGSSIPSAPGGIGLFEILARETLVLLPLAVVDKSTAAGFAAVSHFALLMPTILLGQVYLWANNVTLHRLSRGGADTARSAAGAGVSGAADEGDTR